jgi:preprotein translocase subunit SecG
LLVLKIILSVVFILVSFGMIAIILMQQAKQAGLTAITGETESYFGRNKGKTMDAMLGRLTIVLGIFFAVIAIVLGVLILQ